MWYSTIHMPHDNEQIMEWSHDVQTVINISGPGLGSPGVYQSFIAQKSSRVPTINFCSICLKIVIVYPHILNCHKSINRDRVRVIKTVIMYKDIQSDICEHDD